MFLRDDHVGRGFVCVGVNFSDNSEKVIKDCVSCVIGLDCPLG